MDAACRRRRQLAAGAAPAIGAPPMAAFRRLVDHVRSALSGDAGAPFRPRRFAFAMQGLGSGAITLTAGEEKRAYLPRAASGEAIAAFALSEPDAGSDVAALNCAAREDGDSYVLNGEKTWISNGGIADFYVVFARTGEGEGSRGISAFIVDAGARDSPSPSAST